MLDVGTRKGMKVKYIMARTKDINSKNELIKFRLNKKELEVLKKKMLKSGYETLSEYIRAKTIGRVKRSSLIN